MSISMLVGTQHSQSFFMAPGSGASCPSALKFANCELWIEQRELVVAGAIQRVQPRVFDLLLYLVQRRDRVVSRDELLHHVWRTEHVSDSVIGRCVMKARRVIGDVDPESPIIRTLPRAGYRFVGKVSSSRPTAARELPRHGARRRQALTVAALPFHNLTGNDELVWVEFGLAALLNRELDAQEGLAVTPLIDVVTALKGSAGDPPVASAIEQVSAIGTQAVILVQVYARDDGFELRYQLHCELRLCDSGQVCGFDLTQLTIGLGRKLGHSLATHDSARLSLPAGADTFTSEAFARAMRAAREQRYQMAQDYLQVCVVAEPHALEMDVEHVESLAAIEHPETHSKALRVLALAAESADVVAQARVLRSLSSYCRALGNNELARTLIHRALELVEREGDDPLTATVLLERSELAITDREFELAQSIWRRILAVAQGGDCDRLVAQCLRQEGVIAHLCGDAEQALDALRRSAQLSRTPDLRHADLARTLHRIAIVHRDAGRMRDAAAAIDEAVDCARLAGTPVRYALVLAFQLTVQSYAGNQAAAEAAYDMLESAPMQQSRAGRFLSQLTGAWLSWRAGRVGDALRRMAAARELGGELRHFWLSFAISMNAGMAVAGASYDLARDLIAEMEANRRFYEGTCLHGYAEYFRAALAHAQGDRVETWRALRETLRISSVGVVRSNACLAAAWLACEDRALQEVQGWLDEAPAWTAEHPNGIMVLARYRFELGDWKAAAEHQARYVECWPYDEITLYQRRLLTIYRVAMVTQEATAIPRLPHLLTLRF